MPLEDVQFRLSRFRAIATQQQAHLDRITAAADKARAAVNGIGEKANLNKSALEAKELRTNLSLVEKVSRGTTAGLEGVERSVQGVNDEGEELKRYNDLLKKSTKQATKFDSALGGVTSEIDEQIEKMRRQTREQDRLNKARLQGSRIPDSAAPSPDHDYRRGHWRRRPGTGPDAVGIGRMGGIYGRGGYGRYGGVGGGAFVGAYAAGRSVRSAFSNAFSVNQLLTTIRAEGATDRQVERARQKILEVSGTTRFTAEDVGTYILQSMRAGFDIGQTTRSLTTTAGLAIAGRQEP